MVLLQAEPFEEVEDEKEENLDDDEEEEEDAVVDDTADIGSFHQYT